MFKMSTNFCTRVKRLFFKTSLTVRAFRLLPIVCLILFGLVSHTTLKASHIIGGEINYEFVGFKNGRVGSDTLLYRIKLTLLRDCNGGATFDRTVPITIYLGNNQRPLRNVYFNNPKISKTLPDQSNPCLIIPPGYCEEEAVYVDTITLIKSSEAYTITYQLCCRNAAISNIPNSGGALGNTFTVAITSQAQNYLSSSPQFAVAPKSELCINTTSSLQLQVNDKDGDRLSYQLCAPLLGGGPLGGSQSDGSFANSPMGIKPDPATPAPYEELPFSPNFSFNRPLGNVGGLSLDSLTGLMRVYPRALGNYTIGVCVNEYRNGELIGMIRRDIQIKVSNCNFAIDAKIKADSSNNQGNFWVKSCNRPSFAFSNTSTGEDKILAYRWEFNINGRSEVRDTKDASFDFGAPGQYKGVMVLNPGTVCTDTAYILVEVFPSVRAGFEAIQPGCDIGAIRFNNTSQLNQGASYRSIEWNFGDNMRASDVSPQHNYSAAGSYPVSLAILTNTGCRDTVRQTVNYYPASAKDVRLQVGAQEICAQSGQLKLSLELPPVLNHPRYLVEWDYGDGTKGSGIQTSKSYPQTGTYTISYRLSSPGTCSVQGDNGNDPIQVVEKPVADFSYSPETPSVRDAEVTFTESSTQANNWRWSFGNAGTSTEQNPVFTFPYDGDFVVKLVAGNGSHCRDSISKVLKVNMGNTFYLPTAFTPNGNSANAVFKPLGLIPGISNYEFRIYSRWGQLLFQTQNLEDAWNGKINNQGKDCEQGVYTFQLVFQSAAGKTITKQGTVMLLR